MARETSGPSRNHPTPGSQAQPPPPRFRHAWLRGRGEAHGSSCPMTKKPRTVAGESRVARAGVEPATFHFSGERYYQLSYLAGGWPVAHPATPTGLEPATSAVTGRRANQLRHGANFLTCWLSPARVTLAALPGFGKSGFSPLCNPVQGLHTGVSLASPTGFEPVLPP